MLYVRGHAFLSPFRQLQLKNKIRKNNIECKEVAAYSVYLIKHDSNLLPHQINILLDLLSGEIIEKEKNANNIIVTPRMGTISPWSSKATDILQHCGLTEITRVERALVYQINPTVNNQEWSIVADLLYDRMTESVWNNLSDAELIFSQQEPKPLQIIDILNQGKEALNIANRELGLALDQNEVDYLFTSFSEELRRNPTDAELMMFAQANSEHCRHKIFNANWHIDGMPQSNSLFQMIRHTHQANPQGVITAYKDNGAVIEGNKTQHFYCDPETKHYEKQEASVHTVIKVETHNHPTAIAPFAGAATGSGGELRDEAATGIGAKPKAGLTGFSVSNLNIPEFVQPWEFDYGSPRQIATSLDIMLYAPIGAASYNNEFGRPNLCGYFRTLETKDYSGHVRGYHKPIMIAGGLGNILEMNIDKKDLPVGAQLIVLGGPALLIGLGGGASSSMTQGTSREALDFASVQRANPEMQRRAQEVINQCFLLKQKNPILSIHDVGAGGLANAMPELVHASKRGASIELRTIPNDELGLSPMEIWCNEAQERFVLSVLEKDIPVFTDIAERERCPYAIVGEVIANEDLIVGDGHFDNTPVNMPLAMLFGNTPRMLRDVHRLSFTKSEFNTENIDIREAITRVLCHPTVANKSFLITIGDRTVGGLTVRDQMVGPWQVPVADCAVTAMGFYDDTGEAMAMGERAPVALIDQVASARMAVGEAITNIAAASIEKISDIKLSANWMAACGFRGEDAGLYDAVQAVGMELCPRLGIAIPVGKDSLSMRAVWKEGEEAKSVTAPLSLIVSAFAPVKNIRKTLTPQLQTDDDTDLIFIDLGKKKNRLGGSIFALVFEKLGNQSADLDDPDSLNNFFKAIQLLQKEGKILAYHDRSDGGLFVTLSEMAFAAHAGISILLNDLGDNYLASLFNEELGAVIQVKHSYTDDVLAILREYELGLHSHVIGTVNSKDRIEFYYHQQKIIDEARTDLQKMWSETSFRMQSLRDNPVCAEEEFENFDNKQDQGLFAHITFDQKEMCAPYVSHIKPKVAILREQGVNGHIEMAAAFERAGFQAVDVHMSDILAGRASLADYQGIVAGGGFSYGDVLGAGRGWAKTIRYNNRAYDEFSAFFLDENNFALGICNGCQMLSHLKEIIPGSGHWPTFVKNQSEQFEARLVMVEIMDSPSIFFQGMQGSKLPVVVSHGEGYALWSEPENQSFCESNHLVAMRYIDPIGAATTRYPYNPNGSPGGITALTNLDGRVTILMPHPERVFLSRQFSWSPPHWAQESPWFAMFANVRKWVG